MTMRSGYASFHRILFDERVYYRAKPGALNLKQEQYSVRIAP